MDKESRSRRRANTLCVTTLVLAAAEASAGAGIATDGSTGAPARTIAGVNAGPGMYTIPQSDGRVAGNNLFHSFRTFNIDRSQTANFVTNNPAFANVISRVTGGQRSDIYGRLQLSAAGGSSPAFYFINPAGVLFGPRASINVPGAFHVSTADYLRFANGDASYANPATPGSTFSSAPPAAFGFLGTNRSSIMVNGGGRLETQSSRPISIVAGDVKIDGGSVWTHGGDIRVVALGQAAQEIGLAGALPAASGDLFLFDGGLILSQSTPATGGGSIAISAGDITIDSGFGGDYTGIFNLAEANANAGPVHVRAANISIAGQGGDGYPAGIFSQAWFGSGHAGRVEVSTTGSIFLAYGGQIAADTFSGGDGGSVAVHAESISVDGQGSYVYTGYGEGYTGIFSNAYLGSTGNAGRVEITTAGNLDLDNRGAISAEAFAAGRAGPVNVMTGGHLSIDNGGVISSSTFSPGDAGPVKVSAGSIALGSRGGGGFIGSQANFGSSGNAGTVEVLASGRLAIDGGGAISASTSSSGHAGAVMVTAGSLDIGKMDGGGIFSQANRNSQGHAGTVNVVTTSGDLSIDHGGQISSSTFSRGNAGSVTVESAGSIAIGYQATSFLSGIFSQATSDSTGGHAGPVNVTAKGSLSIDHGGQIGASTFSAGNAGNVTVHGGSIAIGSHGGGGMIKSQAEPGSSGNAGNVEVTASGRLSLDNRGQVASSTFSSGDAGTVTITAGSLDIDHLGGIFSQADGTTGRAGNISVTASGDISIDHGGAIVSDTSSWGNAGSVEVVTTGGQLSIDNGGVISSSTFSPGDAGPVKVSAGSIALGSRGGGGFIGSQANSGSSGNAGTVEVLASGRLSIDGGGAISSSTSSSGHAGAVTVTAGSLDIGQVEGGGIFSQANRNSQGHAGTVNVVTTSGDLSIDHGGQISSSTFSRGNAGSVTVESAGSIAIGYQATSFLSGIFSQATSDSAGGHAGPVNVTAKGSLSIDHGGQIDSSTFSAGNAGNVTVHGGSIAIGSHGGGGMIKSQAEPGSSGNAGNVEVTASGRLSLDNRGQISSSTTSSGNAGTVTITAGSLDIDHLGGIFSQADGTTGRAGNISVTASGDISIDHGGAIASDTSSWGNAGSVEVVTTGGQLSIDNGGAISSSTFSPGDAGPVKVSAGSIALGSRGGGGFIGSQANSGSSGNAGTVEVLASGRLSIDGGGAISSSTSSSGHAGAVTVTAGSLDVGQVNGGGIYSQANRNSQGHAGTVNVVTTSGDLSIDHGGQISSSTFSRGNAGSVTVESAGSIAIGYQATSFLSGIFSQATSDSAGGHAGPVSVTAKGSLSIDHGGQIDSSTFSAGNAGNVTVRGGSIAIGSRGGGGTIKSQAEPGSSGNAGNVEVTASGRLSMDNRGQVSSSTFSSGNAGTVTITAGSLDIDHLGGIFSQAAGTRGRAGNISVTTSGDISIDHGGGITSDTSSWGNAGRVEVVTTGGQLSIDNGGAISSSTFSPGDAGPVKVSAGSITLGRQGSAGFIDSKANSGSSGNAGTVEVLASGRLSIDGGGAISSSTFSSGNAGAVTVTAGSLDIGQVEGGGVFSQANRSSQGHAGTVNVVTTSGDLSIDHGGQISSSTFARGNAGSVTVESAGSIAIAYQATELSTGIYSQATSDSTGGHAGPIDVTAKGSLSIDHGGQIDSSTFSAGNAGNVTVHGGSIAIGSHGGGGGMIRSQANSGSSGNAGNVDVTASGRLSIDHGGEISSSTFSSGSAGTVRITTGSLDIANAGGIFTQAAGTTGKAGKISVTATGDISIDHGGGIASSTLSRGDAGTIEVDVTGQLRVRDGSAITSSTRSAGRAGGVLIKAGQLAIEDEGGIFAAARAESSGQTGSIAVSAEDLRLSNGGQISISNDATVANPAAAITPTSITVTAPRITIKNSPDAITTKSTGNVAAGNIYIHAAEWLHLDPSGITTTAQDGNGGSIAVRAGLLWLQDSQIATSVKGSSGNGGNITIDADSLILNTGFIQANTEARNASGGLVSISARNLIASGNSLLVGGDTPYTFQPFVFGYNVIQAAAPDGVSGSVQLSTPVLDISGSLLGLDARLLRDAQVARRLCETSAGSSLVPVGRGGLPRASEDLLSPSEVFTIDRLLSPAAGLPLTLANDVLFTTCPTSL